MGFALLMGAVVAGGMLLMLLAQRRAWGPPILVTVVIGLALRLAVVFTTTEHTPRDVGVIFHQVGTLVRAGLDPLTKLLPGRWNFCPPMSYVYAVLAATHWTWTIVVKLLPVACDAALIVLVSAVAPQSKRTRAFQYAVCPIAVLVSALHGQIEPIALVLGVGALLLAQKDRPGGGVLLGLAIAVKSWPILFLPGLVATRRSWVTLSAVVAVPLAFIVTMPLVIKADLVRDVRIILSYRSPAGWWGWGGLVSLLGNATPSTISMIGHIGEVITVAAIGATAWINRNRDTFTYTLMILLTFLFVTTGFGPQYLMWPVPLVIALRPPWTMWFLSLSSTLAFLAYVLGPGPSLGISLDVGRAIQVIASVPVVTVIGLMLGRLWTEGRTTVQPSLEGAAG